MRQQTAGNLRRRSLLFILPALTAAAIFWQQRVTVLASEETQVLPEEFREDSSEADEDIFEEQTEQPAETETSAPETEAGTEEESYRPETETVFSETEKETQPAETETISVQTAEEEEEGPTDGTEAAAVLQSTTAKLDDRFISVKWTDSLSGQCFEQGKADEEIRQIREGVWELEFTIFTSTGDGLSQNGNVLGNGVFDFRLVLPLADVQFSQISGQDTSGYLSWSLEESTGILTLTKELPSELSEQFHFSQTVTVTDSEAESGFEEAAEAFISKTGFFNPFKQGIDWTVCAQIPSFTGKSYIWTIIDKESYDDSMFGPLGDLRVQSVSLSSNGYRGAVPKLEEAGEEDLFSWQLISEENGGHTSVSRIALGLLNRCSCSAKSGCLDWDALGGCGTRVQGDWCSCWKYPYNAELTALYEADAVGILQGLEDSNNDQIWALIQNDAILEKNGEWAYSAEDTVYLKKILTKTETAAPSAANAFVGSYRITVNPNHYDYSGTDCITVTDTLQNLAHLATGGIAGFIESKEPLTLIDESEAASMTRSAQTENRYYSVSVENCFDENKTGEILTIKLWFPTDLAFSVCYDAMIIDPELPGSSVQGEYGNSAKTGDITVSLSGSLPIFSSSDILSRRKLILTKVDAEQQENTLEGAEFEVYFYRTDLPGGVEDVRLNTIITDESGTGVFCSASDAQTGAYVIQADQLYYLREVSAPEGYEPDEKQYWFYWRQDGISPEDMPEAVTAEGEGKNLFIADLGDEVNEVALTVPNKKKTIPGGPELPDTGGSGSLLYMTAFLLLSAAALAALALALFRLRDLFCQWYTYEVKQRVHNRQNG